MQKCVFCGKTPEKKNKEHVLPQWLLKLTGDPNRVVPLGFKKTNGHEFKHAFNTLVAPSCSLCNTDYSTFESEVQKFIVCLINREELNAKDWIKILDWLDKVRVGLWLLGNMREGETLKIKPSFYINHRIRSKDRIVAYYTIDTPQKGLSITGSNTPIFSLSPCCISLQINNIILLSVSADFILSPKLGFPFPTKAIINLDLDGIMETSNLRMLARYKKKGLNFNFIKPTLLLLQPIIQEKTNNEFCLPDQICKKEADYIDKHTIQDSNMGVLFKQNRHHLSPKYSLDEKIKFNSVKGFDCKPAGEIILQTLKLQNLIAHRYEYYSQDKVKSKKANKLIRNLKKINENLIKQHPYTLEK